MQTNTTYAIILLLLLFAWISGFFIVPHWPSYLAGSIMMYLMGNLAYTKLKNEAKQLANQLMQK